MTWLLTFVADAVIRVLLLFNLKLDLYDKILSETSILYLIGQASFILIVGLHL